MKARRALIILLMVAFTSLAAAQPVRVIFDTDMGNDIDDALALAMLHAFESRGEAKLLAVTITKDNRWAAPYVDLVNTFYGRPDIPVGVVHNGKTPESNPMIQGPSERKRADGSYVYPHRITDERQAPEAVSLLRRVLAEQPDGSVVIVQTGFSTNLARLLDSPADSASPLTGRELAEKKVRLLVAMAGDYVSTKPEFNVETDVPSAKKVFGEWPTPIVVSGFEVGEAMLFPATSIEHDFAYVPDHPVAEAYRLLMKMPYNRPTWDLTAALYAVWPDHGFFNLSPPGRITVLPDGGTRFTPDPKGSARYLIATEAERPRTLETMILLASEPPEKVAAVAAGR
ncbi:MAG TPA: nucleoside hydrolase [Terriglobales bacterium]|nr:nucleoside hydrolase [Terriglobales bacterium]